MVLRYSFKSLFGLGRLIRVDYNPICPSMDNVPRGLRAEPATHMQSTQHSASVCFPLGNRWESLDWPGFCHLF